MSETRFTPGPWRTLRWIERIGVLAGNMQVADCGRHGGDDMYPVSDAASNVANAHLISAAPELLEALEHMRHCQSCAEAGWDECDGGRAATAAIAKARGESPDRGNRARGK